MNQEILQLLQQKYPQIAEKSLQEEIAAVGKLMRFKAGEMLMDVGSYIKVAPLMLEGVIKVSREDEEGNELFLYYLEPGQTCTMSFSCCLMQKRSEIRTVAEEDSLVIAVPVKYLDEWMTRYQSWKNFVMNAFDTRMMELIHTIDEIAFRRMDQRLLNYLQKKAEISGSPVIQVTHHEIARDLNASREAVSRLLKQLEIDKIVRLGRNKIEIIRRG